MSLHVMCK